MQKTISVQREFLRNIYMILVAQWGALTLVCLMCTYWHSLRLFVQHWIKGLEMTVFLPGLISTVVLMLAFKTDPTKNMYARPSSLPPLPSS
jgi:hypothetical protein